MSEQVEKSKRQRLVEVRDELEYAIFKTESARDLPALSREYRNVIEEIEKIDASVGGGSPVDEIAQARARRRRSRSSG